MKESSQKIEWLKNSKFANKTKVNHMFWVRPNEICRRKDGWIYTTSDVCNEIINQLRDESHSNNSDRIQDWYGQIFYDYFNSEGICYVFTQMPPLEESFEDSSSIELRIKKLKNFFLFTKGARNAIRNRFSSLIAVYHGGTIIQDLSGRHSVI
jgi:hypothetical protein